MTETTRWVDTLPTDEWIATTDIWYALSCLCDAADETSTINKNTESMCQVAAAIIRAHRKRLERSYQISTDPVPDWSLHRLDNRTQTLVWTAVEYLAKAYKYDGWPQMQCEAYRMAEAALRTVWRLS